MDVLAAALYSTPLNSRSVYIVSHASQLSLDGSCLMRLFYTLLRYDVAVAWEGARALALFSFNLG